MKQSSIDWLIDTMHRSAGLDQSQIDTIFEQAKAMHKDEIVDSIVQYMMKHHDIFTEQAILNTVRKAEQYYNKTFNTKEK